MSGLPLSLPGALPLFLPPQDARASADANPHGHEWQRELQRAQSNVAAAQVVAFLQGLGEVKAPVVPMNLAVEATGSSAVIEETPAAETPALHPASNSASADIPGDHAATHLSGPAVQAAVARTVHGARSAPALHAASRPAAPMASETSRAPVRVHADWSAEGVRIWLGIDASTASAVQSIANQLQRWLAAQGVRGLAIACNGRTIVEHWPDADESTETPSIATKEKP